MTIVDSRTKKAYRLALIDDIVRVQTVFPYISVSTGWLCAKYDIFSPITLEQIAKDAGADAIEINLQHDQRRIDAFLAERDMLEKFSVHMPDYRPELSPQENFDFFEPLLSDRYPSLFHPLNVPDEFWDMVADKNYWVAIENMDPRKPNGKTVDEIERLINKYGFDFVLDIEHTDQYHDGRSVYNDLALDFMEMLNRVGWKKLAYVHYSGGKSHRLVHSVEAGNQWAVDSILNDILSVRTVPIIIEGEYELDTQGPTTILSSSGLRKEINYLRDARTLMFEHCTSFDVERKLIKPYYGPPVMTAIPRKEYVPIF